MRLLDRYLLRELLIPFGYCLSGFFIFWITFDLFGELTEFQNHKLKGLEVAHYYLIKTPETFVTVLPIALLLAMLYALTNHARYQELTAMRAAGISLWRLALPYFGLGFILSLCLFAVNELWVPRSVRLAEQILNRHQPNRAGSNSEQWERKLGFTNTRQNRKWFIEAYNVTTHEMFHPHVEWILATGTRWEISSERAFFEDGHWIFTNVQERIFPAAQGVFPAMSQTNLLVMEDFREAPEDIQNFIKVSKISGFREARKAQLSIREILDLQRGASQDPKKKALLDTKLHGRLAAPWTCLVVVLIALPFGAATGRRNVFVGVASSILICFTFFVLSQFGLALGAGKVLPPWVAAWMPNLFFAVGGTWMIWRVR